MKTHIIWCFSSTDIFQTLENDQLQTSFNNMSDSYSQLQSDVKQLQEKTAGNKQHSCCFIVLMNNMKALKHLFHIKESRVLRDGRDSDAAVTSNPLRTKRGLRAGQTVRAEDQIWWS